MTQEQLEQWVLKNGCTGTSTYYANRISYLFAVLPDGWIAIFERYEGLYTPVIQAADRSKAESYCILREPVPAAAQVI